jgi:hypothetical protein
MVGGQFGLHHSVAPSVTTKNQPLPASGLDPMSADASASAPRSDAVDHSSSRPPPASVVRQPAGPPPGKALVPAFALSASATAVEEVDLGACVVCIFNAFSLAF